MTVYDALYYFGIMQGLGMIIGLVWSVLIGWANLA